MTISDDDEESNDEDEDTCGRDEKKKDDDSGDDAADSDNDFQLNLNEDDEEESESELVLNKNHHKKMCKANKNKIAVDKYAFNEDDTNDSEVLSHHINRKSKASLNGCDIPLTNTIPSNQPVNNFGSIDNRLLLLVELAAY